MVGITSFAEHGGKINSSTEYEWQSNNNGHFERYTTSELLFEISSAFGTTGLSTGLTANLSTATLAVLILIMFIGQLGVSSRGLGTLREENGTKYPRQPRNFIGYRSVVVRG